MRPRPWLALGLLLPAGCASTHPGGQAVEVVTDPAGATATAGDQKIRTPGKVYALPGAREMEVVIEKEGFESTTVTLKRNGYSFGECLGQGLTEGLIPPPGTMIDVNWLASQIVERLLLLAFNCEARAEGLRPAPVYVTLQPVPPTLRSPRN